MALRSCPSSPPTLHIARLPEATSSGGGQAPQLQWHPIRAADSVAFDQRVEAALGDTAHEVLEVRQHGRGAAVPWVVMGVQHLSGGSRREQSVCAPVMTLSGSLVCPQLRPAAGDGGQDVAFEAVVVRRQSAATPAPAVLFLHGGPHSAYVASYVSSIAYLAALGYVVVVVSRLLEFSPHPYGAGC